MADEVYISEARALDVLTRVGDYSEAQARIILGHSRKQDFDGATYYPAAYIWQRAGGPDRKEISK